MTTRRSKWDVRPLTPDELADIRPIASKLARARQAHDDARAAARNHVAALPRDIDETEMATALGVNRTTIRAWKSATTQ